MYVAVLHHFQDPPTAFARGERPVVAARRSAAQGTQVSASGVSCSSWVADRAP